MQVDMYAGKVIQQEKEYEAIVPVKQTWASAGLDVATPYPFELAPNAIHFVNTGLIIKAPRNHCILVLPRSGLATKHGIVIPNSPGLIDRDYCGPNDYIKICLKNTSDVTKTFERGDRIAQFLFVEYLTVDFLEHQVPDFSPVNRGGFGSTGV